MKHKTITVSEFVKGNLENDTVYSITKDKPLKWKIEDWLKDKKLDSYSRSVKRNYRKGITNDLSYKNTLDRCVEEQYIRFMTVEGYSDLMELKHKDEIDKNIAHKVKKLIKDNKVGYLDGDSCGCYLACRKYEYRDLCKYLNVEYDERDDDTEFYYNSLFDDIEIWFSQYCDVVSDIREGMSEKRIDKFEKAIYDVTRYVIVHIDRYTEIII